MQGHLLLVIPPIAVRVNGVVMIDGDFANNLEAYLRSFAHVTVACPLQPSEQHTGFPSLITWDSIAGHANATFVELPYPYREDRYYRARSKVAHQLRARIDAADYLLISQIGRASCRERVLMPV